MKKGKIIIISGPSGSGKTTLYKKLLENHSSLVKSISVTTRPKRPGEIHGKDYIFVTPEKFLYKIKAGHFLEHQKVFGNYYGTPSKSVKDLLKSGKNVLLCIDVKGANVVIKKFSNAKRIFIKTPTLSELKKRLLKRASENAISADIRLKTARDELKESKKYDHIIINDDLNSAFQKLTSKVDQILKE